MTTVATKAEVARAPVRRWWLLGVMATAQLMLVLDVTVVNVALPQIGHGLHLSRTGVPWVITAYTLTFGGLMLVGGRMTDVLGARPMLTTGLALFTVSSSVCALAGDQAVLLGGRTAQGVAAALLSPAALAQVTTSFQGAERSRALAVWSTLSGLGAAMGVVIGGVLTTAVGWRWVFAVNVPVGAVVLLLLPIVLPSQATARVATRLDLAGALLSTAAAGSALYGVVDAGAHGWGRASTVVWLAVAVALWLAFVRVERGKRDPLVAVDVLRRRPVLGGVSLMLVGTGLLVGGFFTGSFGLQAAYGWSALEVGLGFLPVAAAVVTGAQVARKVLSSSGPRNVAVSGLVVTTGGYAVAASWVSKTGLVAGLSLAALGIGAVFVTAFTSALADAVPAEAGMRSSIVGTAHELGGALGVAVLSTALGSALTAPLVTPDAFTDAFRVGALAAGVAAVLATVLVPAGRPRGQGQGHAA